ncbi:MAG: hypothetical protein HY360_09440 [Verrucomicrobia bacterium]|nr:hypothetical protein [Verrucomicrobiota bacterium]
MKADELEPFQINRRDLDKLFRSPRTVERMIAAGWIERVRAGKPGRETLFDYESAKRAYDRYRAGEEPDLLPREKAALEVAS